MYIWMGIEVDEQLTDIKKTAEQIEKRIGFVRSNFTLPYHISLKISFEVNEDDFNDVISDISQIYDQTLPFSIDVCGIEFENSICWIRMRENSDLNILHDRLNNVMLQKYGIPLHEYDTDYKFHTTLFMDDDSYKVERAYNGIRNCNLPEKLIANKFVIGASPSGEFGTYRVIKEFYK